MLDRAMYDLAEKYDGLKSLYGKATQTLKDFDKAEIARQVEAQKKRQALQSVISSTVTEMAKAGEARVKIENEIPAEIRRSVEAVSLELAPHKEGLEEAKRRLAGQIEHVKKTRVKYDPNHNADKVELRKLDEGVADRKKTVEIEEKRCEEIQIRLDRAIKARDEFARELKAKHLGVEKGAEKGSEKPKAERAAK